MPFIDLTYPENALSNSDVHRLSRTALSRSRFLSRSTRRTDFAIAQQDRFPQPTSPRLSERNLPPGHSWLEIIKWPTLEAFAAAFTKDVVLEASVLPSPITGAADVRSFFEATRAMYDTIAFKHEVTVGSR